MQSYRELIQQVETSVQNSGGYKAYYLRCGLNEEIAARLADLREEANRTGNINTFCKEAQKAFRNLPESAGKRR